MHSPPRLVVTKVLYTERISSRNFRKPVCICQIGIVHLNFQLAAATIVKLAVGEELPKRIPIPIFNDDAVLVEVFASRGMEVFVSVDVELIRSFWSMA